MYRFLYVFPIFFYMQKKFTEHRRNIVVEYVGKMRTKYSTVGEERFTPTVS